MRAIIPFKKTNAKSRLGTLLSAKEREEFALAMLNDVAGTLFASGCFDAIDILSNSIIDIEGANIVLTEKGLNEALNEYLQKMSSHSMVTPVLIIMADVPLVSSKNIKDLIASYADVAIVPGRMGGTNALFIRDPASYHVDYYGASFLKHREIAIRNGLVVEVFDSFNLSTDIDEIGDLAEVLIHGEGQAAVLLKKFGFSIAENRGRVGVKKAHHA